MRVLFIYPNIGQIVQYNHGIASLSAVLKQTGHKTSLFVANDNLYFKLKNKISSYKPQVICFSIVSNYWSLSCSLAKKIKKDFDIKIFAGGMHCSIFPQSYDVNSPFDGICRGEGEEALLELVERIETQQIYLDVRNFWFKHDGKLIKNEIRPMIENLDILPFPDRDIFPDTQQDEKRFMLSRGCPFACSYCSNKAYHELIKGKGKIIRRHSVDKAIEEITHTVKKYNPKIVHFDDDSFNIDKEWFCEFTKKYSDKSPPPFRCNTRPELITEPAIQLFKKAGCSQINIGIESGDPEIRKNVLKRHMSNEQIINAFKLAKRYGIKTYSFNMVGIPGETMNSFRKTINLNQIIQPDKLQISIFYPYPGTELGDLCIEKGYLDKDSAYNYFYQSNLKLPGFNKRNILVNKLLFQFNVYKTKSFSKAVYYLYRDLREYLEYKNKAIGIFLNTILIPMRFIKKKLHRNNTTLTYLKPSEYNEELCNLINSEGWEKAIAQHLRYLEPVKVSKFIHNCDELKQGAWKFFLATSKDKRVLNVETGLGASSILLAKNASKVYCLHYSEKLAQCIAKRAESLNIKNLETCISKSTPRLPFEDNFFDIVALHKIEDILKLHFNSKSHCKNLNILLNEINRVLHPKGVFYLSSNKKAFFSFSQNGNRLFDFPFIKKSALNQNFHPQKLMTHLPDFERTYFIKEYPEGNLFGRRLLNHLDFSRRNNFALILTKNGKEAHNSFITDLLDSVRMKTGEKKLKFIKIEFASLGSFMIHTDKFVIRIPNGHDAYKKCENNFRTLEKLKSQELLFRIPEPVIKGVIDNYTYFAETRIKGITPMYYRSNFSPQKSKMISEDALKKLMDFHMKTSEQIIIDKPHFDRIVGDAIDRLLLYVQGKEANMLNELRAYLAEKFIGKKRIMVCCHGDYHMANILCNDYSKVSGVIDWELSMYPGLPYIDFIRYRTFEKNIFTKKTVPELIYELICDKGDDALDREYFTKFNIDEAEMKLYKLMALIYCLAYQQLPQEIKFNESWHKENITNILVPACEKILRYNYILKG